MIQDDNQHYTSLLLWWDVDTKALKNKTHIPLSQSVAILFPQFEQNLLVSCLLCKTCCLPSACQQRWREWREHVHCIHDAFPESSIQSLTTISCCFRFTSGVQEFGENFRIWSDIFKLEVMFSNSERGLKLGVKVWNSEWSFRIRSEVLEFGVTFGIWSELLELRVNF